MKKRPGFLTLTQPESYAFVVYWYKPQGSLGKMDAILKIRILRIQASTIPSFPSTNTC